MKNLKRLLNWLIWSLVAAYIVLLSALHVPAVQQRLGRQVAQAVGGKLGTEVSVGRIDLGMLNRLIVDSLCISDQQGHQLLRANRLSVKLELLPLLEGRIAISSAQAFGLRASLSKADSLAKPNFQFVIDSLASDDAAESSPLDLRINSLIVRQASVSYDQLDQPLTPGQLNPNHLNFSNISAHVILKTLTEDSLWVYVKRLALDEQSGFRVERLTGKVEASARGGMLTDFRLQLPHSEVAVDTLSATYQADSLAQTLHFATRLDRCRLVTADLVPLLPQLEAVDQAFDVEATLRGTAHSLDCPHLEVLSTTGDLAMQARFEGFLPASSQGGEKAKGGKLSLERLDVSAQLIDRLTKTPLLSSALGEGSDILGRLGNISISGEAQQQANGAIDAQAKLATALGRLQLQLATDAAQRFSGLLTTDSLHLGRLLDNANLGQVAAVFNVKGSQSPTASNLGKGDITVSGKVAKLQFKGYTYKDIGLDGTYSKGGLAGSVQIDDPNMETSVEYKLTTEGKANRKAVKMTGTVERFCPQALHLTDQWGDAVFSAIVDADITASTLNNAVGSVDLDNFSMTRTDSLPVFYHIDNLHLKSGYDDEIHFLRVKGDMGEALLRGDFDWETLPRSFVNYTASKLPTLPGLPAKRTPSNNNFEVHMKLYDTEWLSALLGVPLTLYQPLHFNASIHDGEQQISLDAQVPAFAYDQTVYHNADVHLTTEGDTARCQVALTKVDDDGQNMNVSLDAIAANNQLNTTLQFGNSQPSTLNAITELYTNEQGKPEAHVRVLPSLFVFGGKPWQMEPCDILYSDKRLLVDHFSIAHEKQHLIIDGIASNQNTDTLRVDFNQLDVSYILDVVDFDAVSFDGQASGQAELTQLFGDFTAWAGLRVAHFQFQEGNLGTLLAYAEWDAMHKQINIEATAEENEDDKTLVEGYISPTRNEMELNIGAQGTSLEFCNSFTSSFLDRVSGKAYGDLTIGGDLKHLNMEGQAVVAQGQATVKALGTTYRLENDTVRFVPNDIIFDGVKLKDRDDHVATLSGGIHHDELSDFTFDLDVNADRLLAYDFSDFGDGVVCGTVYVTGQADMHGRPGEVTINCNVTPTRGSTFAYNAANPDAISQQEFITWGVSTSNLQSSTSGFQPSVFNLESPTFSPRDTHPQDSTFNVSTDIRINFIINATQDATLQVLMDARTGDYITLCGDGVIRASFYDKGPFHMFGTYNIDHGTYGITIQNIIKKNFNFMQGGTIVFGGDPFDAALHMQASYTVNGVSLSDLNLAGSFSDNTVRVNCLMNINGTPGQPQVDFDLEMPTVNSEEAQMIRSVIASEQEMNQQVLYLLGIGRFYTQGANNESTQEYGQTTLAMQSFLSGTVSTQINEVLSQVIRSNDWNFGANISTGNEGWRNAEYEGMVSGRMLNNRLLINGQFGYRDNATTAAPSFIGDFDIRYLLNANGNLALKVYNQTNDRYFTRSSLNTQGIGIIMKKDFNGLRDLFQVRRRKK